MQRSEQMPPRKAIDALDLGHTARSQLMAERSQPVRRRVDIRPPLGMAGVPHHRCFGSGTGAENTRWHRVPGHDERRCARHVTDCREYRLDIGGAGLIEYNSGELRPCLIVVTLVFFDLSTGRGCRPRRWDKCGSHVSTLVERPDPAKDRISRVALPILRNRQYRGFPGSGHSGRLRPVRLRPLWSPSSRAALARPMTFGLWSRTADSVAPRSALAAVTKFLRETVDPGSRRSTVDQDRHPVGHRRRIQ